MSPPSPEWLLWSIPIALAFGLAAYRARMLDASGALAGGLFAFLVLGLGGWAWAVPSFFFFLSSSLLSRLGRRDGEAAAVLQKDAVRDAGQVVANGGVAGVLLLLFVLRPDPLFYWGFLGAFAAAAADTWATEIGQLSRARPRHLRSWRPVPRGTSGAVSLLGFAAAAAGALAVATAGALAPGSAAAHAATPVAVLAIGTSGWVGALVDSVACASVQAVYLDPETSLPTERGVGRAGAHRLVRGCFWMDNDRVNLLATLTGALVAVSCFLVAGFGS